MQQVILLINNTDFKVNLENFKFKKQICKLTHWKPSAQNTALDFIPWHWKAFQSHCLGGI